MREYLVVFGVALGVTFLLASLARQLAYKLHAVAKVRDRDVHAIPTPYFGGPAMLGGLIAAYLVATNLPFLSGADEAMFGDVLAVIVGGTVICIVGVIDDLYELDALSKFAGQVLASIIVVAMGVQFVYLPLYGNYLGLDQAQAMIFTVLNQHREDHGLCLVEAEIVAVQRQIDELHPHRDDDDRREDLTGEFAQCVEFVEVVNHADDANHRTADDDGKNVTEHRFVGTRKKWQVCRHQIGRDETAEHGRSAKVWGGYGVHIAIADLGDRVKFVGQLARKRGEQERDAERDAEDDEIFAHLVFGRFDRVVELVQGRDVDLADPKDSRRHARDIENGRRKPRLRRAAVEVDRDFLPQHAFRLVHVLCRRYARRIRAAHRQRAGGLQEREGIRVVRHAHRDGVTGLPKIPVQRRLLLADHCEWAGPQCRDHIAHIGRNLHGQSLERGRRANEHRRRHLSRASVRVEESLHGGRRKRIGCQSVHGVRREHDEFSLGERALRGGKSPVEIVIDGAVEFHWIILCAGTRRPCR